MFYSSVLGLPLLTWRSARECGGSGDKTPMKLTRLLIAAVLMAGLGGLVWWSNKQEAAKVGQPAKDAPPQILSLKKAIFASWKSIIERRKHRRQAERRQPMADYRAQNAYRRSGIGGQVTNAASSISAERVVDPTSTIWLRMALRRGSDRQDRHRQRQRHHASGGRGYAQRLRLRQARRRPAVVQHEPSRSRTAWTRLPRICATSIC